MQPMSPRTKLIIITLILIGVFWIILDKRNNRSLPIALIMLALPIGIAIIADRSPRLKVLVQQVYTWFIIAIFLIGTILLIIYTLHGNLNLGASLLILIPLALLIGLIFLLLYLGPILVRLGKLDAAQKLYTLFLSINANFGFAYLQRGVLRHNKKDIDGALTDYTKALEIAQAKAALARTQYFSVNYSAAVIHANIADIYLRKENAHQAIMECDTGLALHDIQPAINLLLQYRRGYAQLVTGNYDGALQDLNALRFEGKTAAYEKMWSADLNAMKAISFAGLNEIDEAKVFWSNAVQADTNFNNPDWLRETRLWPDALLKLTAIIQAD